MTDSVSLSAATSSERFSTFDEMSLKTELLRGIYSYGYERPSQIQQKAIMPMITGRDIIAQAQSGTGKTGTFTIGALQQLDFSGDAYCQAIFLSPTKELADQTLNVVTNIGRALGVKAHLCIGGKSVKNDIDTIKKGVHIAIGTPGRIYDLLNRGAIDGSKIKILVIDEADTMLDRGFKEQLYYILKAGLSDDMQICLFSATLSDETLEITNKFMNDPIQILVKKSEVPLDGIKQYYINIEKEESKLEVFFDIFESISITQCFIYCNSKTKVDWLYEKLKEEGIPCAEIHGEMKVEERESIMDQFRAGGYKLLITTDLLARGIDVQGVSIVINYDVPTNRENYIHRIGRTGRYGRKGCAINFITPNDGKYIKDIETYYSVKMHDLPSLEKLKYAL
jgi:translation initiation factor 4A